MMSYIFLFISAAALVAYCFLKMKRDRYYALISAALKDFDYFSTSIYMEQANNKMLLNHGMHMDKSIKQHFVSVFSAQSFIDCICVSVHMALTRKGYTLEDKKYILKIIKSDPKLVKKMYDDYQLTVSKMKVKKEVSLYDDVSSIDAVSQSKFMQLMEA